MSVWGLIMQLFENNEIWVKILKTMHDGLLVVDTQGEIVLVNPALASMSGYSKKELLGSKCSILECDCCSLIRLKQGEGPWCKLFQRGGEGVRSIRGHLTRRDGSYLPVIKNASLLTDSSGQTIGAVESLVDISKLTAKDEQILELTKAARDETDFFGMVGRSRAMEKVFALVQKASQSSAPVIIYGESGAGKELVARAIHELGGRKEGPYIQLNCAALSASLLESELFGHVKGAFTGAINHRKGRFEQADGGDLFLDEIGELPLSMQVKLLRVLETKQFERVGDNKTIQVDVRIISATNRNLEEMVAAGEFREDLFFRINVVPIYLPPLRERKEDIPYLTDLFIKRLRKRDGKPIVGVSPEVMEVFWDYPWPGNVRELKNSLEYAFVTTERGIIGLDHLPQQFRGRTFPVSGTSVNAFAKNGLLPSKSLPFKHPEKMDPKAELIAALRQSGGNQTQAAKLLGVSRVTVWKRIKKYGLNLHRILAES